MSSLEIDREVFLGLAWKRHPVFLRRYQQNDCYQFLNVNRSAFFNLEIFKILLLYGEMEPVLRVCAHPDNDLATWWSMAPCYDSVSS